MTIAEKLNNALSSGKTVYVSTYTRTTKYTRRHSGMFFMSSDSLCVTHGKSKLRLSMGEIMLVKVQVV